MSTGPTSCLPVELGSCTLYAGIWWPHQSCLEMHQSLWSEQRYIVDNPNDETRTRSSSEWCHITPLSTTHNAVVHLHTNVQIDDLCRRWSSGPSTWCWTASSSMSWCRSEEWFPADRPPQPDSERTSRTWVFKELFKDERTSLPCWKHVTATDSTHLYSFVSHLMTADEPLLLQKRLNDVAWAAKSGRGKRGTM